MQQEVVEQWLVEEQPCVMGLEVEVDSWMLHDVFLAIVLCTLQIRDLDSFLEI